MSIVAVGTVAFDAIETPFAQTDRILGGSATYLTLAARFLTEDVGLVAVVGGDFPEAYIIELQERGIGTEGLVIEPDGKTFFWAGRYHYDLNNRDTLDTQLNVLATFDPVVPEAYQSRRIVCLGNLDPTVQQKVMDQVPDADLVIADTMNFWIENTPDTLAETLRRVDVLVINDAEVRQLAGESNLIKAARKVRGLGPETLVVKKGEHGALLFAGDEVFAAPAYPLEDVYDPTGAGDAFLGGFAGYLAGQPTIDATTMKQAIVMGSVVASFCVEALGPERLMLLTRDEIDARVADFHRLCAIPEGILVG
ncbi:MAG: PfkB family carbohydrate kinase [Bacteroidota bacterium]